jgi:hypothetical protein
MSTSFLLLIGLMGQTSVYGPRPVLALSESDVKAREHALAVFRAERGNFERRLIQQYKLENARLRTKIRAVDEASDHVWSLAQRDWKDTLDGGLRQRDPAPLRDSNLPAEDGESLEALKTANLLLKWSLKDSAMSYRNANRFYQSEHGLRVLRARGQARPPIRDEPDR